MRLGKPHHVPRYRSLPLQAVPKALKRRGAYLFVWGVALIGLLQMCDLSEATLTAAFHAARHCPPSPTMPGLPKTPLLCRSGAQKQLTQG